LTKLPRTSKLERRNAKADDPSMLTAARRMLELMSPRERRRLWFLTPVVTLNALVQVLGIASVMPFLALVASPDAIREQAVLRWAYAVGGFQSDEAFMLVVGIGVLVVLVASNAFAAWSQLLMLRFSWDMNHLLSVRMLRAYLFKPYVFFLDQNTSGLAKNILAEVKQAVAGFLNAGMNLVARGVVALLILGLLVAVDPVLALATFGFLGLAYGGVFMLVQRVVARAGLRRAAADRERFKAATEALNGVKEIKLLGKEQPFLRRYEKPSLRYARNLARMQAINLLPRYAFETIAFGGMLIIVIYLMVQGGGLVTLLPTLGLYAFASYRLLPALQGIFSSLTDLKFSLASVELLHHDLERGAPERFPDRRDVAPLPFRRTLELRDLSFSYPNARQTVLEGFDLRIEANSTVALVGSTGAGKTTVVDLLLGLLRPQGGALVVDGVPITDENLSAWQRNLGYVPQSIYLADDSVAANIAFGVPPKEIDMAAVELAARRAHIHDFIVAELPHGYATEVGERGVRLSGGQRQRLGIARALFHDPDVLILDEATSALDNITEESIFHAVSEIGRTKTVIMIAHRISTVRGCDVIHMLEGGRLVGQGSYQTLLASSPEFRALARVDPQSSAVAH
jgi:ATP-binding cassette, subfamily B, bacterial PglK